MTPAEAARLLGKSPARVREMIRRGELTQERVGDRWLISCGEIDRTLNPSSESRDYEKRATPRDQRAKPNKKGHEGKTPENTSLRSQSLSKTSATKKTPELVGQVERLDKRMGQIDAELRDLQSGLMNDEKRERIEKLKTEKRKYGKNLPKLKRELSRWQNRP